MKKPSKSNFNFLDHYTYFVPTVPELLILLLWFVVGAVLGNVVSAIFMLALGPDAGMTAGIVVAYPIMFIPPMIYASSRSRSRCLDHTGVKLDSPGFGTVGPAMCAVLAAVGTLALSFIADGISAVLPKMPESLKKMLESMVNGNFFVNFLCVSIFAPLFEEWLCRGMVLRGLLGNGLKPVWAVIISAVFFAVIHLNPWQAIPAFLLGCLFGLVYYKTGSLKLTMLMHFVNNTFALVISRIPAFKDMDSWVEVVAKPDYFIVLACCVIVTALVVLKFARIQVKGPKGNMDEVPSLFEQ